MRNSEAHETLVEFVFKSRARADLTRAELLALARQAWSFNTRMGISGEMRLVGGRFVQVVEGRCGLVQALAARILGDARHGSIRIQALRRLETRCFAGWSSCGFEAEIAEPEPAIRAANLHSVPLCRRPVAFAAGAGLKF